MSEAVCEFPVAPESRTVFSRPGFGAASWVASLLTTRVIAQPQQDLSVAEALNTKAVC